MYTILDEAVSRQWKTPIRPLKSDRPRSPGESRARKPEPEPEYAPWKPPFKTEEEWQGYLKDLLEGIEHHPETYALMVGVLDRLRDRQDQTR